MHRTSIRANMVLSPGKYRFLQIGTETRIRAYSGNSILQAKRLKYGGHYNGNEFQNIRIFNQPLFAPIQETFSWHYHDIFFSKQAQADSIP